MRDLFVDTGAFIALADRADQYHEDAVRIAQSVWSSERLFTSDFVLDETATFLARALGAKRSVAFVRGVLDSPGYQVFFVDPALLVSSLDLLVRHAALGISLTDASTMALVRSRKIDRIFTFDSDFRKAGFEVIP